MNCRFWIDGPDSFAAGYIAGVFCAAVSHPADNLVSKLNSKKGATVGDIIKDMGWYNLCTRGLGLRILMVGECRCRLLVLQGYA